MVVERIYVQYIGKRYSAFSFLEVDESGEKGIIEKANMILEHLKDFKALETYWKDYFGQCPLENLLVSETTLSRKLIAEREKVKKTKVLGEKILNGFLVYLSAVGFNGSEEGSNIWFNPSKSMNEHFKRFSSKTIEIDLEKDSFSIFRVHPQEME